MSQTIGELSTQRPVSTKVFQRHGIDFCCGGGRTLDEACALRRIEPALVLAEIAEEEARLETPTERWDLAPTSALITHLLDRYHAPLLEDLAQLEVMARKVLRVHGHKDTRLAPLVDLVLALRSDLEPHLAKEEQILFPWILSANPVPPEGPVAVMLREHDAVGELLQQLGALTDQFTVPSGACATWTTLWTTLQRVDLELREHISLENNVLFPRALAEHKTVS